MKAGTENRKKTIAAVILFAIALLLVGWNLMRSSSPAPSPKAGGEAGGSAPGTSGAHGAAPMFSNLDPSLRTDLLKGSEEVEYEGSGHDIFRPKPAPTPTPIVPVIHASQGPTVRPSPTPTPRPPINLKFYGFASSKTDNVKRVFLSEGEYIFIAKEGDIVRGRYRIIRVNPNSVEVEDVLNNNRQSIPLTAG